MDFKWLWKWPENKQPEEEEFEESDSESESEEGSSQVASTSAHQQKPSITPLIPPQGKPVNPKVFFANERTFLHWMQCILLS